MTPDARARMLRAYLKDQPLTLRLNASGTGYVEVTGGGYAAIPLDASRWSVTERGAEYPKQVWTFAAPVGLVYGYAVTSAEGEEWGERFPEPVDVRSPGERIEVVPKLVRIGNGP